VRDDALQLQTRDVMFFFYGFCGVLYMTLSWYSKFVKLSFHWHHSFVHVERGYSEMAIFVSKNYFFCARFLERWVEWCWIQRNGEFDINQVLIVEPVSLIGDLREAETFFLAFEVTRTAKSCFGQERGTPLVRVPVHFWTFLGLVLWLWGHSSAC